MEIYKHQQSDPWIVQEWLAYRFSRLAFPPKDLTTLHRPDVDGQNGIKGKVRHHGDAHPRRLHRFPAKPPVKVEGHRGDGNCREAQRKAHIAMRVVALKGVGLRERAEIRRQGVIGGVFKVCKESACFSR